MKITEIQTIEPKDTLGMLDGSIWKIEQVAKPLPNSTYFYAVVPKTEYSNNINVYLLNPNKQVVGAIEIQVAGDKAYVQGLEVDKTVRGQGLATSLYGIVLSILQLKVVSDTSQTPGGARTWVNLSKIPGVEVKGLTYDPSPEEIEELGATKIEGTVAYIFPVTVMGDRIVPANTQKINLYSTEPDDYKLIAYYNEPNI